MKVKKQLLTDRWETLSEQKGFDSDKAQLVFAFGDSAKIVLPEQLEYLRQSTLTLLSLLHLHPVK